MVWRNVEGYGAGLCRCDSGAAREKSSSTRNAIERRFAEQGINIRLRLELDSNAAIEQAILAGLGISASCLIRSQQRIGKRLE